jgi:thioredoxin-related protein
MKPQIKLLIIILVLSLLAYKQSTLSIRIPTPSIVVPVVEPKPKPELATNIVYDDLNKAADLAKDYGRNILVIFGADWCPYCKVLKKDIVNIDTKQYIVCIVDTDKNTNLVNEYKIKGLPTSIILNISKQELTRKTGYKADDYNSWLKTNTSDVQASWIQD